jgi:hypothetical protein
VGQERAVPFIAMEYLLGAPLDQYLKTKGELPLPHALRVCREVALGLAAVHDLGLFAERAPWTDDTLSQFAGCKTLRWANLCGTKVTDACLAHLTDSKGMSGLLLADTKVADAGLVHLKHITGLRTLQLDGTAVTDAGLSALAECKQLTELGLSRTTVTAKGVGELAKALPLCKIEWDGGTINPPKK